VIEGIEVGLTPMVNFNRSGEEESTCRSQPHVVSSAINFCLEFLFQAVLGRSRAASAYERKTQDRIAMIQNYFHGVIIGEKWERGRAVR